MKKFNFLIFVGIAAILLSGCKSSETSETSETGVSSVSSSGSQSDSQSVVSSTSTTTSTTTSTSSSIVSSTSSSSSSSVVSTSTQSSTAVESSSSATSTTSSEPQPVVSDPEPEPDPEPAWTETPASGTMYVNTDGISSRKEAVIGAEAVKQYSLNDQVTITAKTDTNYYKIEDGTFIHSDYLSKGKYVAPQPTTSSSNGPKKGDIKTENGQTYVYLPSLGWIISDTPDGKSVHEPAGVEPDPSRNHPIEGAY